MYSIVCRFLQARWTKVVEAAIVAAITATLGFTMIYFLNDCKHLGEDPTKIPVQVIFSIIY